MTRLELLDYLTQAVARPEFHRASFAGRAHGPNPNRWQKVQLRPVPIRETLHIQFSYFDGRKTILNNRLPNELLQPLAELMELHFSDIHLTLDDQEVNIRQSKQGKIHLAQRKTGKKTRELQHNRTKDVPLPEGLAIPVFEMMGLLTPTGQVRPSMRAKFTQINEFLKHLKHVIDDTGLNDLGRPIEILDCGCGAAYLTIAVHYYLNEVLNWPARVIGVDVNDELIRKCLERTEGRGLGNLNFVSGAIGQYTGPVDVVLALHACNRATDEAILQARRGGARLFLGVPCCHQDLNQQLQAQGNASVLQPLLRHGILRERMAEMLTDTFRSLWLTKNGYRTEVVEFTSPEHTARNVLIRAVRRPGQNLMQAAREFEELKRFWGVRIYLEEQSIGDETANLRGNQTISSTEEGNPP